MLRATFSTMRRTWFMASDEPAMRCSALAGGEDSPPRGSTRRSRGTWALATVGRPRAEATAARN